MNLESIFLSFPRLETARLVLRRMAPSDAPAIFRILADGEVTRYYDDEAFTDLSQALEQLESWERGYARHASIRWGITLKEDDTLIGTCGFYSIHPWHLRASTGYELARPCWRRGIMLEAMSALLEHGFGDLGLNRIDAVVLPANTASVGLLEKLGFIKEGLLKGYENWGAKGYVDLDMYALLREAWIRPGGQAG